MISTAITEITRNLQILPKIKVILANVKVLMFNSFFEGGDPNRASTACLDEDSG